MLVDSLQQVCLMYPPEDVCICMLPASSDAIRKTTENLGMRLTYIREDGQLGTIIPSAIQACLAVRSHVRHGECRIRGRGWLD